MTPPPQTEQPQALEAGLILLNARQRDLITDWAKGSQEGDMWGNSEAVGINLTTFARAILGASSGKGLTAQVKQESASSNPNPPEVCGEKPWTVEDVMRMLGEAAILKQYPWVRINDAHNTVLARLTARIRELEEEIKTMEMER